MNRKILTQIIVYVSAIGCHGAFAADAIDQALDRQDYTCALQLKMRSDGESEIRTLTEIKVLKSNSNGTTAKIQLATDDGIISAEVSGPEYTNEGAAVDLRLNLKTGSDLVPEVGLHKGFEVLNKVTKLQLSVPKSSYFNKLAIACAGSKDTYAKSVRLVCGPKTKISAELADSSPCGNN